MKYIFVIAIIFFSSCLLAQEELKPVEDQNILSSLLGDSKVSKVTLLAQGERNLTVSVTYKNLPAGKKFVVKGTILNRIKRQVPDIPAATESLSGTEGSADLTFSFNPSRDYTKTNIESLYIMISIIPEGKSDDILNDIFDNATLSGDDYMYHLRKDWRVGGSENMTVTVQLVPYKTAAYLKP